jgi:protein tyrosine phosphatase (PTP) superfamily phosphohydrolase (DUF442 family)
MVTGPAPLDIYNYRAVDGLLSTSGQPTEDELRAVAAHGFHVVINLALHGDPRYSLADEAGLVTSLGLTYVHIPVVFTAPTEADLFAFFTAMDVYRERRKLVHCAANKRVSSFVGLHRVIRLGWDEAAAFALMRDVWEPDPVWAAFIAAMLAKHRP